MADGRFCRLLSGFEAEDTSQRPVLTVYEAAPVPLHGVSRLTPAHEVTHVLGLTHNTGELLMANRDFSCATVYAPPGSCDETLNQILLTAVYSRLAQFSTLLAHAALVNVPGQGGLMFVGPSGIGKTTQAELWARFRGAEIINGDKVFLTVEEGGVMAHGSPWNGNSPYRLRRSVPLRAVVSLTQDSENSIRPLNEMEKLTYVMPHIFLPQWDDGLTAMAMETVGETLPRVSAFRLACRPDEEAVDLTNHAVFETE